MISQSNKITLPFILKVERTEIEMCPKLVTTKNSIDKQSDMVTSTMHMIMQHTDKQTNNNQSICHMCLYVGHNQCYYIVLCVCDTMIILLLHYSTVNDT